MFFEILSDKNLWPGKVEHHFFLVLHPHEPLVGILWVGRFVPEMDWTSFGVPKYPSWELTCPLFKSHFWRWCSFSEGGIGTRFLEGTWTFCLKVIFQEILSTAWDVRITMKSATWGIPPSQVFQVPCLKSFGLAQKGMETFCRKVIRNKDSVVPLPKTKSKRPLKIGRPFPQKERQTTNVFLWHHFSRGKLAVCFRQYLHIFIYTHLEKKLRIPCLIPWSVGIVSSQWVSGVATVGFGDLAPVTSWEA